MSPLITRKLSSLSWNSFSCGRQDEKKDTISQSSFLVKKKHFVWKLWVNWEGLCSKVFRIHKDSVMKLRTKWINTAVHTERDLRQRRPGSMMSECYGVRRRRRVRHISGSEAE